MNASRHWGVPKEMMRRTPPELTTTSRGSRGAMLSRTRKLDESVTQVYGLMCAMRQCTLGAINTVSVSFARSTCGTTLRCITTSPRSAFKEPSWNLGGRHVFRRLDVCWHMSRAGSSDYDDSFLWQERLGRTCGTTLRCITTLNNFYFKELSSDDVACLFSGSPKRMSRTRSNAAAHGSHS